MLARVVTLVESFKILLHEYQNFDHNNLVERERVQW